MTDIADLWNFELCKGSSDHPRNGACLYDAANWIIYGTVGDDPPSACPVTRAFAFRRRFEGTLAQRVRQGWTDQPVHRPEFVPEDLPFSPVELAQSDLTELIAKCAFDHTVGPGLDTPSGPRAGYARWA